MASHTQPSPFSGHTRETSKQGQNVKNGRDLKWHSGNQGQNTMYYSSRNKAFLRNLNRRSTSQAFPIACNPHCSLLQLAYKLRMAEKAMHGNRSNAVAGQIPIPHSSAQKSSTTVHSKRNFFGTDQSLAGPTPVKNTDIHQRNSLWPVLIGARGSDGLDLDEGILAKYNTPSGAPGDDADRNQLAQPLSSTEMENIVQNAINCVINSRRQRSQGLPQSVGPMNVPQIKQEEAQSFSDANILPVGKVPGDNGTEEEYQLRVQNAQPFYELVKVGNVPPKNTPPPTPSLVGTVRKHRCPMCDYETDNKSHLRRHQSSVHQYNVPYFCHICKREFPRSEKIKYHFQRVHPGVEYDPKACKRDFSEDGSQSSSGQISSTGVQQPSDVDTNMSDESDSDDLPPQEETSLDMTVEEEDYVPFGAASRPNPQPLAHPVKQEQTMIPSPSKLPSASSLSTNKAAGDRMTYKCPQCAYLGRDIWHLRRHMSDCHSISKQFHCSQCTYATSRRHRMVSHMKSHGKLVCMYCDLACEDLESFQEHLRVCSSSHRASLRASQFLCRHCNTVMPNRTVLRKHLAKQHQVYLQSCHLCTFTTHSSRELENHLVEHSTKAEKDATLKSGKKTPIKVTPNTVLDNKEDVRKQIHDASVPVVPHVSAVPTMPAAETLKSRQKEMLSCSICDYKTQHRVVMKSHLRKHQEISEKEECSYPGCTFTTNTAGMMARHINKCHMEEELLEKMHNAKGIFPCPVCTDRPPFRYRKSFEKHMDTHKKEETCPLCDEAFYTFELLKKHITGDHEAEVEEVTDSEDEGIDTKQEAVNQKPKKGRPRKSDKLMTSNSLPKSPDKAQLVHTMSRKNVAPNEEEAMDIDKVDDCLSIDEITDDRHKCNSKQSEISNHVEQKQTACVNSDKRETVSIMINDTNNTISREVSVNKLEENNNPDLVIDGIHNQTYDHSYAATVRQ